MIKSIGYFLFASGFLAVAVLLMLIKAWPGEFQLFLLISFVYFTSIALSSIYFGYLLSSRVDLVGLVGALVLAVLSTFSFTFLGFSYSVVLGVGIIVEVNNVSSWIITLKFPMAEFATSYNKSVYGFAVGINLVSLAVSSILFKEIRRRRLQISE